MKKRKNRLKNFWDSISAYELCFCLENLALIIGVLQIKNFNNFGRFVGVIAALISIILIIVVIISNAYNSFESDINLSYKLEKRIIIPLNIIKTILCIIEIVFLWFAVEITGIKTSLEILSTVLLLVANLKYYHTVLTIKERILDKYE